jgi:REP element-mobilizing transposase RayT
MTRVVRGEDGWDDVAKEVLRKQLWQAAEFSGVQILTYCILSNHFHVLVRVPSQTTEVSDAELLRRYAVLYPKPTAFQTARLEVLQQTLAQGGPEAEKLRTTLRRRMHDVSEFMKTVKQRFSVWFNRTHQRLGTLWTERFKSVLVEDRPGALRVMAAYIDLNPVRAGLVSDPKDYRFCGYGEALGGAERARAGLRWLQQAFDGAAEAPDWRQAQAAYRLLLVSKGEAPARGRGKQGQPAMAEGSTAAAMAQGGELSLAERLRCRIRYLSDGAVLGSQAFVQAQLAAAWPRLGRARKRWAADLGAGLAVLRGRRTSHAPFSSEPRSA